MRPDEHKRRKNEKYKKKHALSSGGTLENEAKSKNKKSDTKDRKKPAEEQKPNQPKPGDQSEDKDETPRRLPDNWDRYEELEEDRFMPEIRGEDFSKLIAESGGSASRFRFKDEDDWTGDASETDRQNQGLTLDFENLSEAISCIPLYERLDLSKDLFNDEQLEEMTKVAEQCQKQYEEANPKVTKTVKQKTEKDSESSSEPKKSPKHYKTSNEASATTKSEQTSVKVKPENKHGHVQSTNVESHVKTVIDCLEDDLDSLLSADSPRVNGVASNKIPASQNPSKSPAAEESNTASNNKRKTDNSPSTEDWLDELLGD